MIHDHHLVKCSKVISLDKLTATGIYSSLTAKAQNICCLLRKSL